MRAALTALLISTVGLGGCDKLDELVASKVNQQIASSVATETEPLRKQISDLEYKVSLLEAARDIAQVEMRILRYSPASLQVDDKSYGLARTKHGVFIVSVEDVTPRLDGYTVKLKVGNLTSAEFTGATLKVEWGLAFDAAKYEDVIKSRRNKEFSTLVVFKPGRYAAVEVNLSPAKPEEVKSIQVGLDFDRLSLIDTAK